MNQFIQRSAQPGDYDQIVSVVDEWWGRPMVEKLPRLFLDHFHATSFMVEDHSLAAFLVGFLSPSSPEIAYIHFVAVRPDLRGTGLARQMYEGFFALASADGRSVVRAITSPANEQSIAFHRRMGFEVAGPLADYNGPGTALMEFSRPL